MPKSSFLPVSHKLALLWLAALAVLSTGCRVKKQQPNQPVAETPSTQELERLLDEELRWTFQNRHLNTERHKAWDILHGALTFKRGFLVKHQGKTISAVDHILAGGRMVGWDAEPGALLDEKSGRRGLRVLMNPGAETGGQGHHDQWLAVLAQCGLQPEQTIRVGGTDFTMADYVEQVKWEIPRNVDREYSWTLIGLTTYLPTDAVWQAEDGRQWSIARLVQSEAERAIGEGACGGTHRLIGLAMALNRHLAAGGKLEGAWKLADEQIQEAILRARQYQNADGSFSSNYLARGGVSTDWGEELGTTGHVLEFLVIALPQDELEKEWMRRAVGKLCSLFEKTRSTSLKCGALYHAAHGLALYQLRVFKKPIEDVAPAPTVAAKTASAN